MQPYQEEYIANVKALTILTARKKPGNRSFEEYEEELCQDRQQIEQKVRRNTELLRKEFLPTLDHLPKAGQEELQELREFAEKLFDGREALDIGLYCLIRQALLNIARLKKDRKGMIRELYWLGMGRNNLYSKVIGLEWPIIENYIFQMRLCFTEAAAYLKYYDEIEDSETRAYILRSRANISLGQFKTVSEKIRVVKQTLQILQDKGYQEKAPDLPWDRYIYMTHQQMAASISYSKNNPMTAQDIADAMESVYIVYQTRLQESASRNEKPPIRPAFSYYAIEYYCGLDTLGGLLTKMEGLMDAADISVFSADNMYGLISLPAFYCQYLQQYPERIPERKEYIAELYQRILNYMDTFSEAAEYETLFRYLRQLLQTFVEIDNSITYKEFMLKLIMCFVPDLYVHSYIVGKAAAVFCELILSEEPAFFDDIEHIKRIENPEEKRREVLDYAMNCGLFHDVGKIHFMSLYSQMARQWFEDEYEMAHLHTIMGAKCLKERASTRRYAEIALGHHSWYDGSHGYPDSYKRLQCSCRQMVDVISMISWLENVSNPAWLCTGMDKTFDEAVEAVIALEGRRFSPLLTARLGDREVAEKIRTAFEEGRREADYRLYLDCKTPTQRKK